MSSNPKYSYWATIELYRTFLFEDGPFLEAIAHNKGVLDGPTLGRIAHSYSVARTIPAAPIDDPTYNVNIFARSVIALADKWPNETTKRAEACRETANELAILFRRVKKLPREGEQPRKLRKVGTPQSAVTKLIWFLKPHGWTVFDRYAADAVLVGTDANVGERQQRFYEAIAEPLAKYADSLSAPLGKLHHRLHPERLIDKYLVLKGLDKLSYASACDRNRYFLQLLPDDLSRKIEHAAMDILPLLPNDAFPKHTRRRQ